MDCIVFCSGKTGGSTLTKTIRNNNMSCIHLHNFNCNGLSDNMDFDISKENIINIINNSKKIYIIDSYRLPIERKISSFFQNLEFFVPNYQNISVEELINIFNTNYINTIEDYHSINLIMDEYNIERFKQFNFKERYNIKEHNNIVFIKILFKDINEWSTILSNIFKKNIIVEKENINNNELYKNFKLKYKVPKTYIDNILKNDKEFKIYNTENEQELYIQKWLLSSIV